MKRTNYANFEKVLVEREVIEFDMKDITLLIVEELERCGILKDHGMTTDDVAVTFNTKLVHMSDEWGITKGTEVRLEGATVELSKSTIDN